MSATARLLTAHPRPPTGLYVSRLTLENKGNIPLVFALRRRPAARVDRLDAPEIPIGIKAALGGKVAVPVRPTHAAVVRGEHKGHAVTGCQA